MSSDGDYGEDVNHDDTATHLPPPVKNPAPPHPPVSDLANPPPPPAAVDKHGTPLPPTGSKPALTTLKITDDECFNNFKRFLDKEKKDLRLFYPGDADLKKLVPTAKTMVEKLFDLGCKKEVALQLSILILYDMVMLIDDSLSMETEQEGKRKETLKRTMKEITAVYDLANTKGIKSIKFLNAKKGLRNIKSTNWKKKFDTHDYDGMTRIGTSLQKKILDKFVWEEDMIKPLLVMIITDGDAEGERKGMLKDVLIECVTKLEKDPKRGKQAVAFHFSRVGDDVPAQELLRSLDDSEEVGENVDCLDANDSLELLSDKEDRYKWVILPKLLLGAIMERWDELDDEEKASVDTYSLGQKKKKVEDDSEDEDGSDDES